VDDGQRVIVGGIVGANGKEILAEQERGPARNGCHSFPWKPSCGKASPFARFTPRSCHAEAVRAVL